MSGKGKLAGSARLHGRVTVALGLALLLTATAHAAAAPPAGGAPAPVPSPAGPSGISVQFTQLNWLADDLTVKVPYSRVGVVTLSFDSATASQLASQGAFFNLSTNVGGTVRWSVRNLYLHYRNANRALHSHPSVQFAISDTPGTPVGSIQFSYTLDPGVVTKAFAKPTSVAPVLHANYHVGGLLGGGSGASDTPTTIGDWPGPVTPVTEVYGGETWVGSDQLPTVSEDDQGCAPGSIARSIRYMADNWKVPGPDAQDIYGDLYDDMGTGPNGTDLDDIVDGKADYVADNGLPIDTGSYSWGNVDLDDLADNLANGGDVEILIGWNPSGGHAAMVTSIVRLSDGSYLITYIDDGTQGDGDPSNAEHTIHVDANGNFNGGSVIGFISEFMAPSPFLGTDGVSKSLPHTGFKAKPRSVTRSSQVGLCRAGDPSGEIFIGG